MVRIDHKQRFYLIAPFHLKKRRHVSCGCVLIHQDQCAYGIRGYFAKCSLIGCISLLCGCVFVFITKISVNIEKRGYFAKTCYSDSINLLAACVSACCVCV